ncbi:MAG: aminotransferase [Clostridia bacterium]|nr:aminotransferase [Clostridia bacterium]
MKTYASFSKQEMLDELLRVKSLYREYGDLHLSLDLTRGKPSPEQLDLSNGLLCPDLDDGFLLDGVDVRNYGVLGGLPSTRKLFADILQVKPDNIFVGGNASLQLMYDLIAKAYTHGLKNSKRPWSQEKTIKFLCPSPGYDRHFHLSLSFNMELIPVALEKDGPNMEQIRELVAAPSVKGIWCVPKFSNPEGITYSEAVCLELARLRPAAPDFALMWDNAYCIHSVFEDESIPNILELCRENGNEDMPYMFMSTSKVTFAGNGIAVFASSEGNVDYIKRLTGYQTIGYSKVNEYLHVKFLKDRENAVKHMQKHAAILRPKFEAVLSRLEKEIAPLDIAHWSKPNGGYFISFYAMPHTAARIVELCNKVGLKLTPAGATYPYNTDPYDSNIRIAPSYPSLKDVELATDVLCVCIRYATLEKLLS